MIIKKSMFLRFILLLILLLGLNLSFSDTLESISSKINSTKKQITEISEKIRNLNTQKSSLENTIHDVNLLLENLTKDLEITESQIKLTESELEKLNNQLLILESDILKLELKIEALKVEVSKLISLIYVSNQNYGLFEPSQQSLVKFLFADLSSSEILNEISYISSIENLVNIKISQLDTSLLELLDKQESFKLLKSQKIALLESLNLSKSNLEIQKETQENILQQKRQGILNYQKLIAQSKAQELEAQQSLKNLELDYKTISSQITKVNTNLEDFNSGKVKFSWPVYPSRGVSASFLDASYKRAIGIDHLAIDIPTAQQSKVLAPANAKVIKVKNSDNNSYNYIILAHNQGFTTLYGHMYKALVSEGDFVKRGQVIGLSGGAPGTRGAGYLTTGAHLHFEVHKNGVHVNPYLYLDTSILD